jgi:hypothetical protein
MESNPTNVEELFQKVKDYADVRIDLFKLKTINKVSGSVSSFLTTIVITVIFCIVFLCITIGLALWIGDCIGKAYYGFFIVGGAYLIIGLVLYSLRGKLIKSYISQKLIKGLID